MHVLDGKTMIFRDRQLVAAVNEAARNDLDRRRTLARLCAAEVEHRDQRRVAMGTSIAKFPFVRSLDDYEFDAQPSVDAKQFRDLAVCRWVASGSGRRVSERRTSPSG